MKKLLYLTMLLMLVGALWMPSAVAAQGSGETVDLIVQTEGSVDALVAHIQSLGGTVNFQYRNVPAVAATVPVEQMGAVGSFSGVTQVEKDRLVYLTDEPDTGKNAAQPMSFAVESMAGVDVEAVDPAAIDPEGYANFLYTGAAATWAETGAGDGTVVAVVDTGTVPNTCIGHAVIGAPGYPQGYSAVAGPPYNDPYPATSPMNHWHGTHVGGVIASACALDFSAAPTHPIWLAVSAYLPWPIDFVPIFGQAPGAKLYPVKVFPASGAGVPTSIILDGLDHVLTLKKDGLLDIDMLNMSLGGPTVWDGRDTFDRFIAELAAADVLVVTSAGNEGPVPNSVGSPGTSFFSVSTGALDYATSSRVLYEYLGLAVWPGAAGQGMVMRPTDETRVTNFSSRGPLSDGRAGPDISALGLWNFHESGAFDEDGNPIQVLRWAGGTSFSSPTVAGVGALLNAYWEAGGLETNPFVFRNVLLKGADPDVVGAAWQDINDQGWGAVDAPASLNLLKNSPWVFAPNRRTGKLQANVLPAPEPGAVDTWESGTITLNPSETFDAVLEVDEHTSNVTFEVFDVVAPDNSSYAYWPNALEVHVQSAKRSSYGHPVEVYWYPFWYGDSFDIVVEDGPWTFWGIPWDYQPMEPGLMKLSLIGDYSNEAPVSFQVRVTREGMRTPLTDPVATGIIDMGGAALIPVEVPADASTATFDLTWLRDWSEFPTSDIDMFVYDPTLALASTQGVSGNAPERAVIDSPAPGTWYVYVEAYEVYRPDLYNLFLTID